MKMSTSLKYSKNQNYIKNQHNKTKKKGLYYSTKIYSEEFSKRKECETCHSNKY